MLHLPMAFGLARFHAPLLLVQDVQLGMISEMLGHSTIQLTADIYTHLMAESKRELAEKMDVIT